MAKPSEFVDTNVVVYAFDPADPDKQRVAREILLRPGLCFAPQVLFESTDVLVRLLKLSPDDVVTMLTPLLRHRVVPTTPETVREAWRIMARYRLRIYDATLIAAALAAGCAVLHTEDLQHNQAIEGLRIINPFV